jgi:3-dehydroquinate dehydratase/shikimate dehydrogenase
MVSVYRHDSIGKETAVYGVIADPVAHSLSPVVHNPAFGEAGIDAVYVPFRVPVDTLGQFVEDMPRMGIRGLSVTIPHKEAIAKYLTKVDPAVKGIGAVNTVVCRDQNLLGYNTDYLAAMESLENVLGVSSESHVTYSLQDKRVLVLGAGGVARAIMYGLEKRGAKTTIAGRTKARAQVLADAFKARAVEWAARQNVEVDIIINCTPIGMHPNVDESPYNKSHLKPSMIVFDTVYNPESTLLLKEAKSHGCHTITGVEMFIRQAALQFMLFTGREAPYQLMRDTLKRAIGPVRFEGGAAE